MAGLRSDEHRPDRGSSSTSSAADSSTSPEAPIGATIPALAITEEELAATARATDPDPAADAQRARVDQSVSDDPAAFAAIAAAAIATRAKAGADTLARLAFTARYRNPEASTALARAATALAGAATATRIAVAELAGPDTSPDTSPPAGAAADDDTAHVAVSAAAPRTFFGSAAVAVAFLFAAFAWHATDPVARAFAWALAGAAASFAVALAVARAIDTD